MAIEDTGTDARLGRTFPERALLRIRVSGWRQVTEDPWSLRDHRDLMCAVQHVTHSQGCQGLFRTSFSASGVRNSSISPVRLFEQPVLEPG